MGWWVPGIWGGGRGKSVSTANPAREDGRVRKRMVVPGAQQCLCAPCHRTGPLGRGHTGSFMLCVFCHKIKMVREMGPFSRAWFWRGGPGVGAGDRRQSPDREARVGVSRPTLPSSGPPASTSVLQAALSTSLKQEHQHRFPHPHVGSENVASPRRPRGHEKVTHCVPLCVPTLLSTGVGTPKFRKPSPLQELEVTAVSPLN